MGKLSTRMGFSEDDGSFWVVWVFIFWGGLQEIAFLALNRYIIIKKGYFELLGNTHILVYYHLVSS